MTPRLRLALAGDAGEELLGAMAALTVPSIEPAKRMTNDQAPRTKQIQMTNDQWPMTNARCSPFMSFLPWDFGFVCDLMLVIWCFYSSRIVFSYTPTTPSTTTASV